MKNRKYTNTKKNGGVIPEVKDKRTLWIPVGCQKCMECKKQKARQWGVRLQEEIRTNKTGQFVTLTFSNESITDLGNEIKGLEGYNRDNKIATIAVRKFLERWRKKYKKSIRHWLITELGHEGTENIHLHGLIFTKDVKAIKKIWKYGFVFIGDYVNERTINYITKYTTKTDEKHKEYNAIILTSAGIGSNYVKRWDAGLNKYKPGQTKETYTTRQGRKIDLPIYFRNKIYSEDEREALWIEKLDKGVRWVDGTEIDISKNMDKYWRHLEVARAKNKRLGYGDDTVNWELKEYEEQLRNLRYEQRTKTLHGERKMGDRYDLEAKDIKRLARFGII